ncbi:divalent-cation tolerance protein CutA [Rhodopseudomonas sp. BR0G17]|uniref:divalent-cation tolerance protein CutA n=1 Tax=Rhodopseudomonas sp. BR0G17 TaxID=2269368 RepID=UPI0013DED349|nr:divalent-cation tolerance protein CutA [Rhodopseudomonas sp. BR0G17]NEW95748.1 divalent-cation tolerance protein CutA [Rhodopseudomonas sp. BR0G17]
MDQGEACVVMVTAPNKGEAERLAVATLEARLAACVQIQAITSHYWWDGKITSDAEQLLLFKTLPTKFAALRDLITSLHSYDTPEIIQLPVTAGAEKYLGWIRRETGA